ncbi:four-carbon acid sugar kinase family protein [Streptomyces sp. NPDC054841]
MAGRPDRAGTARPRTVAILADDLTSAGDGAAPFRAAGFPARISLAGPDHGPATGVTAIDLDTRTGPADVAAALTARAATALSGADVVLKTVDSTLRGHLAAEIGAALTALAASGRRTAVIAPAFPAEGRTTVGGVQLLAGRPVHETAFAEDPAHPVRCADLTRLIPGAVRADLVAPQERTVSRGRTVSPGRTVSRLLGTAPLVLADAACDEDLDALVAAVPDPGQVLWVGSPGLAAALARRLGPGPGSPAPEGDIRSSRPRVLVVVGSLHPAGHEQSARFATRESGALVPVLDPAAVDLAERELAARSRALLHGPDVRTEHSVPQALARAVVALASRDAFDALVLTGGETARTVLLALGARDLDLVDEPEPGIALGLLDHPRRISVALKAGGFGDRDTLRRLTDLISRTS